MESIANDFMRDYSRNLMFNGCSNYVPTAWALDASGSSTRMMLSGKTRYETSVDELEAGIKKLRGNETLAENVHLFLFVFGGETVECLVEGKPLCEIDLPQLIQRLRAITPAGRTPMGRCIEQALDCLEAAKAAVSKLGMPYSQPTLVLVGDGLGTDDMSTAKRRISEALKQDPQKLLFLPIGIGDPGMEFPIFRSLLEDDRFETPVLTDAEGFKTYFRLLDKTLRVIERGQYITPSEHFGLIRTIAEQTARTADSKPTLKGDDL